MDTRSKILTAPDAINTARGLDRPLLVVTGYFDILVADHARQLGRLQKENSGAALMVVVLPRESELLSQRARAEMVAALAMVDYVVTEASGDPAALIDSLGPASVYRWEAADAARARQLVEHVQRRQKR